MAEHRTQVCMWHAWETAITQIWMKLGVLNDKVREVLVYITIIQKDVQIVLLYIKLQFFFFFW